MREAFGDLWALADEMKANAVCITTNGFVKDNGRLVMGRGVAQQARDRFKGLDLVLGDQVLRHGLRTQLVFSRIWAPYDIVAFPVKPVVGPTGRPVWMEPADLLLIERSAHELVEMANRGLPHTSSTWETVLLPRPGCGNGGLAWGDVQAVIEPIFDDRFVIVEYRR